jgi:hypothetical protein
MSVKRRRRGTTADNTDALMSDASELGTPSLSGFPSISLSVRQSTLGGKTRSSAASSSSTRSTGTRAAPAAKGGASTAAVVSFEDDADLDGASALLGFGVQNPGKPAVSKKKNAGSFQGMDLSREVFKSVMRRGYSVWISYVVLCVRAYVYVCVCVCVCTVESLSALYDMSKALLHRAPRAH